MTTLTFAPTGYLEDRVHQLTPIDFVRFFCGESFGDTGGTGTGHRARFAKPFLELCSWAESTGVTSIVVGGSFITNKPMPRDLDALVMFPSPRDFVRPPDNLGDTETVLDIQCLSEDEPELLQAHLQLIGADRRYVGRGLIQIKMHPDVGTYERASQQSDYLNHAMFTYTWRHRSSNPAAGRLIIPIHGVRSDASWIPKFTFLASTAGWAIAPFVYGYESGLILGNEKRKSEVVNELRQWIGDLRQTFSGTISVVAHSFGTYITARYLRDSGHLSEPLAGIVLAGSIISPSFIWDKYLTEGAAAMVLNTRSPNDEWVKMLPDGGVKYLASDPLMGPSAVEGFKHQHPLVVERSSSLLTHNNMFEADVITRVWLPFLNMAHAVIPPAWLENGRD